MYKQANYTSMMHVVCFISEHIKNTYQYYKTNCFSFQANMGTKNMPPEVLWDHTVLPQLEEKNTPAANTELHAANGGRLTKGRRNIRSQ